MCGIIGYVGKRQAEPILINGLKKLEYRGYDSAGIGVINLPTWMVGQDLCAGNLEEVLQVWLLSPEASRYLGAPDLVGVGARTEEPNHEADDGESGAVGA